MIHAIAIDDEPKAVSVIASHASKIDQLVLEECFHNPMEALVFLKRNPIDLIFLDINMPGLSGLELLKGLKIPPLVIFTTAYADYALESYSYNAIDYLLKPFEYERFLVAVQKAESTLTLRNHQKTFFFIKDGVKNIKILFEDILFIKGSGNYLDIHTTQKIHSPRMTFAEIVGLVPSSSFARIHQSYIINIALMDKIENNHVHINTHKIPISQPYRESFFKRIDLV